ncbi:MAG: Uma2 family endonuclease [Abditibacteriales bacterium]|nr:Uma2 family endonuclease [Abditibacteriales bacterium]MDW8366594.1 Uma2 family endonuclease [Abditibacteriales bacterium]
MAIAPVAKKIWTDEELMRLKHDGYKVELLDGELKMSPTGMEHELIGAKLIYLLMSVVDRHKLGGVYGSSAGYRMPNGELRSPDVSFVSTKRLPGGKSPKGFGYFAPDLVVEILSPDDTVKETEKKIAEYLAAGTRLAWLVNPKTKTVTVYRAPNNKRRLAAAEELSGEDVVPGFVCRVGELFK